MAEEKKLQAQISFDTSEASKAMKDLSTKTKELTAQLKLNDAEMKRDGTTTDNLKTKEKLLKQQIDAQKNTIAKVTEEYDKAVKAKGADSKEAQALKAKLVALKTTLANQETQLKKTTDESDNLSDSLDDVKDSAKDVKTESSNLGEKFAAALSTAKNVVDSIASGLADMVKETWQITIKAATEYDDAATAAMMNGVSYEEYMGTLYASETFDIDPNAYYNAFTKFKTHFATGNKTDIDDLREILGLTENDFNALYGELINSGDWLGLYEAILGGDNLTNEQLQKMFGEESVKKLQTVIGENFEKFNAERGNALSVGFVATIDQQETLIELSNAWQTLQKNFQAAEQNLGALFAVPITPIISDTASMVGEISAVLQNSFSEGQINVEALSNVVWKWLPKILTNASGILRVAKVWVDLLNGLFSGSIDGLTDNPEMQTALEEWGSAWGDLWGDGENGITGLWATIKTKVLVPLWNWITEKMAEFGAMLWDAVVNAIPEGVRGHLGIQTTEEQEITADYNANAVDIIPETVETMIQPEKRQMSAIERAEYLEGNQFNAGGINVTVNARTDANPDEIGEEVAKRIEKALNDLNKKNGLRTVGGGGRRVRISD